LPISGSAGVSRASRSAYPRGQGRIVQSLKTILLALAIIDDIMAILVITLFYTDEHSTQSLVLGSGWLGARGAQAIALKRQRPLAMTWLCSVL
jgi:Na+/H+ antiporter 1